MKFYVDLDISKRFSFAAIIYYIKGNPQGDFPSTKV